MQVLWEGNILKIYDYTKSRWAFLNALSLFATVIGSILLIYVIILQWPTRIPFFEALMLARASITPKVAGNHSIVFLTIITSAWIIFYIQSRGKNLSDLLDSKQGFFSILLSVAFVPSVHEGEWFIVDFIHNGVIIRAFEWPSVAWLILAPAFGLVYWRANGFGKKELLFLGLMAIFYIWWYMIGFPITAYFTGITPYFESMFVNEVENASWIYAAVVWVLILLLRDAFWVSRRHEVHVQRAVVDPHSHVEYRGD